MKLVRLHVRGHALGAGHAVREAMRAKHWIQGTITNVGVLGGSRGGGCKEENGLHCDVRPWLSTQKSCPSLTEGGRPYTTTTSRLVLL